MQTLTAEAELAPSAFLRISLAANYLDVSKCPSFTRDPETFGKKESDNIGLHKFLSPHKSLVLR